MTVRLRQVGLVGLGILLLSPAATAEWRLSLGGVFRSFDDIEYQGFAFRNADNAFTPGGPFGIQNYSNAVGSPVLAGLADGSGVTTDYVRYSGGTEEPDSGALTPALTLEYSLGRRGPVQFSIVAGLQYYSISSSFDETASSGPAGSDFTAMHYNYIVIGEQVLAPPLDPAGEPGLSDGTSVSASHSFDMDLLILDLGIRARIGQGRCFLTCATGPAWYFADADSHTTERGVWSFRPTWDPVTKTSVPDQSYRSQVNDESNSENALGWYVSLGAGVNVSKRVAVSLEYRQDFVSETFGTPSAELELDSGSVLLLLTLRFGD